MKEIECDKERNKRKKVCNSFLDTINTMWGQDKYFLNICCDWKVSNSEPPQSSGFPENFVKASFQLEFATKQIQFQPELKAYFY
jgi:hypothetical protein